MRKTILSAFLFFSFAAFGQAKTTTILLTAGDCRTGDKYPDRRPDTISFYRLPENTIAFRIIPGQYRKFPIKHPNVPVGEYNVQYQNHFQQTVIKHIMLQNKKNNSIKLCPDSLLEYPQNTLTKLLDKDTVLIRFRTAGCFHSTGMKMYIIKIGDNYQAQLYSSKWNPTIKDKTTALSAGDSLLRTTTLTGKNLRDFIRFENELSYPMRESCTTLEWYDMTSRYVNIQKIDGECTWRGFTWLRISFFGDIND